jgi:hypothetical protein
MYLLVLYSNPISASNVTHSGILLHDAHLVNIVKKEDIMIGNVLKNEQTKNIQHILLYFN